MTQDYSFEDFLKENPILESPRKMKGNAPFPEDSDKVGSISERIMNKSYGLISDNFIHNLSLYEHNDGNYYVVGVWYYDNEDNKNRFGIITELDGDFTDFSSDSKILNNKKVFVINTIHTLKKWIGNGISSALYKYIIDQGYVIISDKTQYEGAVNLWKKFPSVPNSVVYIYDIEEDKIISKYTANTPDTQVWSDNKSKEKIRLVFTKK